MYGAILGDMIGAPYEFDRGNKSKEFELFGDGVEFTDDSVMTIAVAEALLDSEGQSNDEVKRTLVSSMRILPLAFTDCTDDKIREVSAITHGHVISKEACVIYVHVARRLLVGEKINDIIPTLKHNQPFDRLRVLGQLKQDDIASGGYVVDTLEASLWSLLNTNSFKEAVLTAVNLGSDTDTTGAVAGGLAGIVYGLESEFAKECMGKLRGKELILECL